MRIIKNLGLVVFYWKFYYIQISCQVQIRIYYLCTPFTILVGLKSLIPMQSGELRLVNK